MNTPQIAAEAARDIKGALLDWATASGHVMPLPITFDEINIIAIEAAIEKATVNLKAKEQVLFDIHHALGIEWGDDPYHVINKLKQSEDTKRLDWLDQNFNDITGYEKPRGQNIPRMDG